jgi:AhpD family alkylhydroperoxidase
MTSKINPYIAAPDVMKHWQTAMTQLAAATELDSTITELVKLRASQINGCANCLNLHAVEAREKGETERRIFLLPAWREAPCYEPRERAALAWTEALTRLCEDQDRTPAYAALIENFSPEECVKLTVIINTINGWNRIAVGFDLFADVAQIRAAAGQVAV